jgi:hypothetical protein
MKVSINRQELTGPFGGKYYETYIKLSMSDDETEAVRKLRLMKTFVIGARNPDDDEAKFSFWMTNQWGITVEDLTIGITGKSPNESELHKLVKFENLIRERCKILKKRVEDSAMTKKAFDGGSSYEEEL